MEFDPASPYVALIVCIAVASMALLAVVNFLNDAGITEQWYVSAALGVLVYPLALRVFAVRYAQFRVASPTTTRASRWSDTVDITLLGTTVLSLAAWSLGLTGIPFAFDVAEAIAIIGVASLVGIFASMLAIRAWHSPRERNAA